MERGITGALEASATLGADISTESRTMILFFFVDKFLIAVD